MRSCEVVATLLLEEALHLAGGDRAQVDLVGTALGGGLDLLGHVWCSRGDDVRGAVGTGSMVAHRRLFPAAAVERATQRDQVRATRSARSASAPAGSAKARSSPTRSTREYADSMPSARISREPTSTCPARATHGPQRLGGDLGDAVRHLAGAAGEVEGALAGDDEVGGAGPLGEPDGAGDQLDAGLAARAEARAARSRGRRRRRRPSRAAVRRSTARGELLQPAVDGGDPLLGDALLRAEGLGRAEQAGERDVDVGGHHQLDAGRAARGPGARSTVVHAVEAGGAAVEDAVGGGAQRGEQPGAAVVGAGAAEARPRPWSRRRRPRRAPARRRRRSWPPRRRRRRRQQVQAARLGALDVGRVADAQHRGRHRLAVRPRSTVTTCSSPPSAACRTSTKPGPPSAIGARSSSSSGARRRQPVGDRLGRLDGGEGAGELVGRHQDSHARHPARAAYASYGGAWATVTDPADAARRRAGAERLSRRGFLELDLPACPPRLARPASRAPPTTRRRLGRAHPRTSSTPTRAAAGSPRTPARWSASRRASAASAPGSWRRTPSGPVCRAAASASSCSTRRSPTAAAACAGCSRPPSTRGPCAATGWPASRCTRRCSCAAPSTAPRSRPIGARSARAPRPTST